MGRWFLSYNSQDSALAEAVEARLRSAAPDDEIYFAPKSNRAGSFWLPDQAKALESASVFVLLVGERGVGGWQEVEYFDALDRHVRSPDFPVVLLLLEGWPAPGLPHLRTLHWIVTKDPASEKTVASLLDAAAGRGSRPGELWRYTSPYRGLAAMTEADSDFFFGRADETVQVLRSMAAEPHTLPILLGNSGVGKSSLAQAGVLASLKRQVWPDGEARGAWPDCFRQSRHWCFLTMKPGTEPLRALVEPFLRTWRLDTTDAYLEKKRNDWIGALLAGDASLAGLLDATEQRCAELGQSKPPAFFLYIDQGEELYVRAEERQRRRFSELLAEALKDTRLIALMSLRSDFTGELQKDKPLFDVHRKIDVVPLREAELREVVSRPAALLGARFESDTTAIELARKTAEESVKDAGALPLLSYLLDDMWTAMVKRDPADGVLRLPAQALELGGVLAERAEKFVADHPKDEERLRRLLTLKLATVRENADPTRRRALRSEFADKEWRLVSELADHPHRLLVTATPEGGEPYAEVAHEAIFKRWEKLRQWIATQRDFLIWKSGLEAARLQWEGAAEIRNEALLTGLALAHAESWLMTRARDLSDADREFIEASLMRETLLREEREREREQREKLRRRLLQLSLAALALVIPLLGFSVYQWRETQERAAAEEVAKEDAQRQRALADERAASEAAAKEDAQRQRALADARATSEAAAKEEAQRQRAFADARAASEAAAKEDAQRQRALADARAASEAAAKEEAERNFETAKETVNGIVFDIAQGLKNVEGMRIESIRKILERVETAVGRLTQAAPEDTALQRSRAEMLLNFGDTYLTAGDGPSALAAYQESMTIFRKLTESDPTNTDMQRELSVILNRIGDVNLGRGDAAGAQAAYEKGLSIARALAKTDPGNTQWQRDVSISLDRIGDVKLGRGDAAGAQVAYEEGLSIARALARTDPGNTEWQRDVSVSLERVGDVKLGRGDAAGAEAAYDEGLEIRRALARTDPGNTQWQRDVSISLDRIGDVKRGRGDAAGALVAYEEGLAIRRALARTDPGNTQWQRDVSISLNKIGDMKRGRGDAAGAQVAYEEGLSIARALAKTDPGNTEWQRDVSVSLERIGDVKFDRGDAAGALVAYEEGLAIRRALAETDPGNTEWQRDVSVSLNKVGDVRLRGGDSTGALATYEEGLAIVRTLAKTDPGNAQWQSDVAYSLYKIATATTGSRRTDAVNEALVILEKLKQQGALTADQASWPDTFKALLSE